MSAHYTIPLGLYIHIPWCERKCPYCDFNSHAVNATYQPYRYVDALIADLEHDLPYVANRKLRSIFIGGGTPSLFPPDAMQQLLEQIFQRIQPEHESIEITLESNPGSSEQQKFIDFRAAGINRLSIGVQSFQDAYLQALGRIHTAAQAKAAIMAAHHAGFDNMNIDLMYGLPKQAPHHAIEDIVTAIDYQPKHLSWYQLTLEPNTVFYKKPPPLPNDDTLFSIETQAKRRLAEAGYQQYEVSAYCRQATPCQHNLNYWLFGDYLGIGAGAHSKLTESNNKKIVRLQKTRMPKDYLDQKKPFIAKKNTIAVEVLAFEFMLNSLRLYQAIPLSLFTQRTGLPAESIADPLQKAHQQGLLNVEDEKITLSPLGQRMLNEVLVLFCPD